MTCFRQLLEFILPSKDKDAHVDWSSLPNDVLWLVKLKLLIHIKGYIKFGAVCKSWRSVYIHGGRPSHPRQLPLLMLPNKRNTNAYNFYSLTENKVSSFQVPVAHKLFCPGSSYGWLLTVSPSHEMSLVNPFLPPPNNKIELPPVTTFELNIPYGIGEAQRDECFFFIQKLVLSANPASTQNYIAMAAFGPTRRLAFCKHGDKIWTSIPCQDLNLTFACGRTDTQDLPALDIIYYKEKFHVVDKEGQVLSWDVNPPSPSVTRVAPYLRLRNGGVTRYLVDLSGDLLQVVRFTKHVPKYTWGVSKYYNIGFHVFKLDPICSEWIQMENLQGHVLFLGQNSSLAILASDFPECKPNSIYFTDDFYVRWETNVPYDMGIFNMEDNTTMPLGEEKSKIITASKSKMITAAPIWIEPML